MPEHVLIVGADLDLAATLRGMGEDVHTSVLCRQPVLQRLRDRTGHRVVVGLDPDAPLSSWLELAVALDGLHPVTRLASLSENDQPEAAAVAERLGLAMHSLRTVHWVHHKPSMRARLAELGVDDTPFAIVQTEHQLRAFVAEHGLPCIVKPAQGAGSVGVSRLRDATDDVAGALRQAAAGNEWSRGGAMVERLHEGPQYSVEAFSENSEHEIVCCTRKFSDPGRSVELGHLLPAQLRESDLTAVERYVRTVLDALGIAFGPTHTELALTAAGPRLIETHTRLGGDQLPELVKEALGVDLTRLTLAQVLGRTELLADLRSARTTRPRYAAIWFATAIGSGTLQAVSSVEAVAAREGVDEVVVQDVAGQRIAPLESSRSRLAYVRAHGETPGQAVGRARAGVAALRVTAVLDTVVATDGDSELAADPGAEETAL